jgi:hypothetical protein
MATNSRSEVFLEIGFLPMWAAETGAERPWSMTRARSLRGG